MLFLAAPVDKTSMSTTPHVVKILSWIACAFDLEASDRKTQLILNSLFLFKTLVAVSDEAMCLFVAI